MRAAIRDRWGDDGGAATGRRIGEIVFRDRDELEWLEQRPASDDVAPRTDAWLAERRRSPIAGSSRSRSRSSTRPAARARFDKVVVVTAPPERPRSGAAAASPTARRG